MATKMLLSLALATTSLMFATGCSQSPAKKKSVADERVAKEAAQSMGSDYATVVFEKGQATLASSSKQNLKELAQKAHRSGKRIEEIRILAWSDKEYPDEVRGGATTSDIILATERAEKIRTFLEDDLGEAEDIDAYNMAKRPDLLSKILRDDEFAVKSAFETSEATAARLPSGELSYTKAGKAMVIINYEGP